MEKRTNAVPTGLAGKRTQRNVEKLFDRSTLVAFGFFELFEANGTLTFIDVDS